MPYSPAVSTSSRQSTVRRPTWQQAVLLSIGLILAYVIVAYLVVPAIWLAYVRRHLPLDDTPRITRTGAGIPGDPLNVALIGTETELKKMMLEANWYPADPLTLRSCAKIASATVLKRTYDRAPVSNLYLWGRKEDLAFEQPLGGNPRQRHHVRFWRSSSLATDGRPVWFGAATCDRSVGLSHTTGQVTHHIAPDIDTERDHLIDSLQRTDGLWGTTVVSDFHRLRRGRNGGGDPWETDGDLCLAVIAIESENLSSD